MSSAAGILSGGQPALLFAVHEDGTLELLSPWFPRVAFAVEALARADGRRMTLDGDWLTLRCTNGGAVYALGPTDEDGTRIGMLVRSW